MKIEYNTKFNIGDIVILKQDVENSSHLPYKSKLFRRIILGIWIEICYGGTQVYYSTRAYSKDIGETVAKHTEIEFVLASEVVENKE